MRVAYIWHKAGIRWQPGDLLNNEGLMASELRRLRDLKDQNNRLKRVMAFITLDREMLQDVIKRKL